MTDETKNDGGPAFPVHPEISQTEPHAGMALRDWFAAQAMQAICSHVDTWGLQGQEIVAQSYNMADLMLAERSK